MATPHATDDLDHIVGSLRPGSELLDQLLTLRDIRHRLEAENAELRALLCTQQDVIERYAAILHER